MNPQNPQLIDKIHQQFENEPYPRVPIEFIPKDETNLLYTHNLATPYYIRNRKVINTKNKTILDVGCGTGYTSLILALANPGAKVIGIDFSAESIKIAQKRLQHHGFESDEFYTLSIEDIQRIGQTFDYINCDDVLYLLPDLSIGLQQLKSVLKPDGIIRGNLHSSLQRTEYYRAQEVFKMMGLMDGNPGKMEIDIVRETMKALKDGVETKRLTCGSRHEKEEEWFLMNYLFQGDKGYTIPQLFSALKATDLEFISMVNWWQWDLMSLFKEPDNLPVFWGMSLPEASVEEQLHLFELLHPVHRLLDFWCGHPQPEQSFVPISEWQTSDWHGAKVYLHPQLTTPKVEADIVSCITQLVPFDISRHLSLAKSPIYVDSTFAACLLSLWKAPQSIPSLIQLWQKLRPFNLVSLEPTTQEEALAVLVAALTELESLGYVLLESPD